MAATPTIDIVIPVYGHSAELRRCLASVVPQCTSGGRILVVDNAPEPSLERICGEFPGVVCLHEPKPGSYAARNLGISHSTATHIAFTDADCIPREDWLRTATDFFREHPTARILGGMIEVFAKGDRPNWVEAYEMATAFNVKKDIELCLYAPTANLVVDRTVFDAVGLFRSDMPSGGDQEWGRRAASQGVMTQFVAGMVVRHPARNRLSTLCHKRMRVTEGALVLHGRDAVGPVEFVRRCRGLVPPVRRVWAYVTGSRARGFSLCWRLRIASIFLAVHYCVTLRVLYRTTGHGADLR